VRRYHDGWTTGNHGQAIALLAPALTVEVPINAYPTAESAGSCGCARSTTRLRSGPGDDAVTLAGPDRPTTQGHD
jgi:hypothetical protein